VPFVWDSSGALVVSAEDEEAVEHVLDMVEYPGALDAVDGEGDGATTRPRRRCSPTSSSPPID
jgi:hypothetical protein